MLTYEREMDASQALIKRLASQSQFDTSHGSMSPSIYDTAWVSMIQTPEKPSQWLFPECFSYILNTQLGDGGWPAYASEADGILNTAAALLAVRKHLTAGPNISNLEQVSSRAEGALRSMIRHMDVSSCDQVGFELLATSVLALLADEGISLDLPNLEALQARRAAKLGKLPASSVYNAPSTLHHSLEGLIGHIDFDQIRQWRQPNGSMMGSPSSTAAYLIHTSTWDHTAESYLRDVVQNGSGHETGGVPSAWPTPVFEISWAITALFEAGTPVGQAEATVLGDFLESSLRTHGGLVGFEPQALPDADDTAKAAMALLYLGRQPTYCVSALISTFEADDHFRTYLGEMNPSISANINVLSCLLLLDEPIPYIPQIIKASSFVYAQVLADQVKEKWHMHEYYWMMLLSKAMVLLSQRMEKDSVFSERLLSLAPHLRAQIPLASLKICRSVMEKQESDGGWKGGCEVTAYAVLIFSALAGLPWIRGQEQLIEAASRGKTFLRDHRPLWKNGSFLWTEKVTYSSSVLSEAYCLAAVLSPVYPLGITAVPHPFQIAEGTAKRMKKAGSLIKLTPLFAEKKPQMMAMAETEACYALNDLQLRRLDIFPRTGMGEDKYLTFIPLTWFACASLQESSVGPSVLRDMMVLSMLNYQVDEYMEVVVSSQVNSAAARNITTALFTASGGKLDRARENGSHPQPTPEGQPRSDAGSARDDIEGVLYRYVSYIVDHPAVINSPEHMQTRLKQEIQTFLLAHIQHAEDNRRFAGQLAERSGAYEALRDERSTSGDSIKPVGENGHINHNAPGIPGRTVPARLPQYENPGRSFYSWVRSTSADHTSCPFSFIFFNCLIAHTHGDMLGQNAVTAYLIEDVCRHLASLCRMYNDYGSLARDHAEMNLNSVNFPEFATQVADEAAAKAALMRIAEYERRGLDAALAELGRVLHETDGGRDPKGWLNALKLFVNVTDLFGQIYVVKDIATRMNGRAPSSEQNV